METDWELYSSLIDVEKERNGGDGIMETVIESGEEGE